MSAYAISARDGYTVLTFYTPTGKHELGLPHALARDSLGIRIFARWAAGLVENGHAPHHLAEHAIDLLEARAEAHLPAILRWVRKIAARGRDC